MIKTEVRDIPANELSVDLRVQRVVDPRRVAKLASNWDDLMVGVLTVSHRKPFIVAGDAKEELIVLDGQTRLEGLRAVCGSLTTQTLTCQVHIGLTLKEEAKIFLEHNDRKAVSPLDTFRLSLVAGEQWAEGIRDISARYRWAVAGTGESSQRKFQAIGSAKRIYNADEGESLDRTFGVISAAWPGDPGTVCGETLSGVGGLIAGHGDLDLRSLVHKLAIMDDTYRAHPSMNLSKAAYTRTVEIYNSGRRSRRIEI